MVRKFTINNFNMVSLSILITLLALTNGSSNLSATLEMFSNIEGIKIQDFVDEGTVTIDFWGPPDVWCGIGFNGTDMNNTYAIICSGKPTKCQENLLGYGSPGIELPKQINVKFAEDKNGMRYVHMQRKRIITSKDTNQYMSYYQFPSSPGNVNIIAAIGTTNTFNPSSSMANSTKTTMTYTSTKSETINGPTSPLEWNSWINNITQTRTNDLKSVNYNGSIYDIVDIQWTQTSFIQPQMHGYDAYFYDINTHSYTFDKWLTDLKDRYGGIDSYLFWVTYTNIGADDRNQFDLNYAVPGGLNGLKKMVEYMH
eukprot:374448_1